jgi:hypothetical protein
VKKLAIAYKASFFILEGESKQQRSGIGRILKRETIVGLQQKGWGRN